MSKKQLAELVKTAKFEGYYEDAKKTFDELEKQLNHNVATDLDKHELVLRQILESEIIAAYYYQRGTIEAGLNYDKQVKEAIRLLKNQEEYKKILQPKKPKQTAQLIELKKKTITNITQKTPKPMIFSDLA